MNDVRWINPHQPQTLYGATILCYINAFFGLLSLGRLGGLGLLIVAGLGGGGFGIANEKKWGYAIALAAAILQVALYFIYGAINYLDDFNVLANFLFDALLVVLLVHPMSRDYQRIWFK